MAHRLAREPRSAPVEISWHTIEQRGVIETRALETGRKYRIGRGIDCDIELPDRTVSRLHAEIEVLPTGEAVITDLASTNGLVKDGKRAATLKLAKGGEVQIGTYLLSVGRPKPLAVLARWYDITNPGVVHERGLAAGHRFRIGRSSEADIVLPNRTVSGLHAEVVVAPSGEATLVDLDSTNGIRRNGERIKSIRMGDRVVVQIGTYQFQVHSAAAAGAKGPSEQAGNGGSKRDGLDQSTGAG